MRIVTDNHGREWRLGQRPSDYQQATLPAPFDKRLVDIGRISEFENHTVLQGTHDLTGRYYARSNNTNRMIQIFRS